jgi:DNA-binding MarR family transcriptional regulator
MKIFATMNETNAFTAQLQHLLYQLVRAYELCDRTCLAQNGITTAQGYSLLAFPKDGCLTMNELSETMKLSNSTMTRMVDQLVQKGLVFRRSDEADRRVVLVQLTERGHSARRTLEDALQEVFNRVVNGLQPDERPMILYALEQIINSLGKALNIEDCCGK